MEMTMSQMYRLNEMSSDEFQARVLNQPHEPGYYIALVTLSVKALQLALDYKHGNRAYKDRSIRQVMQALTADPCRWKVNGESLKFSCKGRLQDGQNRCKAAINVKKPLRSYVTWGLPLDTSTTMDQGTKRSGGDMLKMAGILNPNNAAAALRFYWHIDQQTVLQSNTDLPSDRIVAYYYEQEKIRYSLSYGRRAWWYLPPAISSALHYAFRQRANLPGDSSTVQTADGLADSFFEDLIAGENISRVDPVYHLREVLGHRHDATYKLREGDEEERARLAAATVLAWNALRRKRRITTTGLLWDVSMPFPEIV